MPKRPRLPLQKLDPEGVGMKEAERLVSFRGKDVLEVGCGNGRLTFQYAPIAKRVVAIDPSAKAISEARRNTPKELASRISFRVGRGEGLAFPDEAFDLAFFSWSLCCTDVPVQGRALMEAWRVLRRNGILLNVMESLHQPFYSGMITYILKRNSGQPDWTEPEREARLALRHASLVERKFDYVAERELPVFNYYETVREALRDVTTKNGLKYADLSQETRRGLLNILDSLRTRKGVRIQVNSVMTVLRKRCADRVSRGNEYGKRERRNQRALPR